MIKKILKNNSGESLQLLNRVVPNEGSYEIQPHLWLELAGNTGLHTLIESGDVIVNNGTNDLPADVGAAHAVDGVIWNSETIALIPGAGENSPGIKEIDGIAVTYAVDVGDTLYGQMKLDNIVGNTVKFLFHLCVNNTSANRWGQARIYYRSTTGMMDKTLNTYDDYITIGPVEVPTTPYLIFYAEATIPTQYFSNGENYLFVGVEREAVPDKDPPDSPFYVLRYEVQYWKRLTK